MRQPYLNEDLMLKKIKAIRSISMAMSLTYTHNLEEKDIKQ